MSIEGDAFHRFDRAAMAAELKRRTEEGDMTFSHFSYEANVLDELERVFREYGETGKGRTRHYVHDDREADRYGVGAGDLHRLGAVRGRLGPAVLRGAARGGVERRRSTSRSSPT